MGSRRYTTQRFTSRLTIAAVSIGLLCIISGCKAPQAKYDWHGQEELFAVFQLGSLHSTLPPEVSVHSVVAAAQMTLQRRGYTITASESTDDQGHVIARPADGRTISRVKITVRLVDGGTSVSIRTYPGGNEHVFRDILERMLTRLGL